MSSPVRFVALGDSYTIGTSVAEGDRWPNQLVRMLGPDLLELTANLGANGYTSEDILEFELPALERLQPGFVSLLVGVNDVVQAVPAERYHRNLREIFDSLAAHVEPARTVVVTTPDYTATPHGGDYGDRAKQRAGILRNNAILGEMARQRRIAVVDIFDISERAEHDGALVAVDGLHPSGRQYALWVERIAPTVASLLGQRV
jgi:acyl-CoA thioesterase-1